jgi:hypothetical protein
VVEDLTKPSVSAKMIKTIRGLSLDASITTESMDAIGTYYLRSAGYHVIPGEFGPWKEALCEEAGERLGLAGSVVWVI